jgi:hypothetical protein
MLPQQQQPPQQQQQQLYQQYQQIPSSVPAQQYGQYPALNVPPTTAQVYPAASTYNNAAYPSALTSSSSGTYMNYPVMPPPAHQIVQSPQSPQYPTTTMTYPSNNNPPTVTNYQQPQQYQHQQAVVPSQPTSVNALDMQRKVTALHTCITSTIPIHTVITTNFIDSIHQHSNLSTT